jgi:hypothetical protein
MIVCFQGPCGQVYGIVDVNSPTAQLIIILAPFSWLQRVALSLALRGVVTNVRKPCFFALDSFLSLLQGSGLC